MLEVLQSNGSLASVTFTRSSVQAYDTVLAEWQTYIHQQNVAAAKAATYSQQLAKRIDVADSAVENDLSEMSPENLSNDLATVENDLATVENDNSSLSNDIAARLGPGTYCSDVSVEYSDAGTVLADARAMVDDAVSYVGPDLQQIQTAMARAPGDWKAYWAAQHALPDYQPTTPVPPLKTVLADGRASIQKTVSDINTDIRQADGYIAQAYAMPNAAQKAMGCGPVARVPTMQALRWLRGKLTSSR